MLPAFPRDIFLNALLASRKVHSVLGFIVSLCLLAVFLELHFPEEKQHRTISADGWWRRGASIAERQKLDRGAWQSHSGNVVCRVSSNSESLLALSSVKLTREAAGGRNLVRSGAVLGGVGDVRTGTYVHVLSDCSCHGAVLSSASKEINLLICF